MVGEELELPLVLTKYDEDDVEQLFVRGWAGFKRTWCADLQDCIWRDRDDAGFGWDMGRKAA